MKPQCTTSAECLRELARVMEQFGIDEIVEAANSEYVKNGYYRYIGTTIPSFLRSSKWSFAIAEVEGKPVFPGDDLYRDDIRFTVSEAGHGQETLYGYDVTGSHVRFETHLCSWNPPKPKTVMVELLVEDVKEWSLYDAYSNTLNLVAHKPSVRLYEACKKALDNLK